MKKLISFIALFLFVFTFSLYSESSEQTLEDIKMQMVKDWERAKVYTVDYLNTREKIVNSKLLIGSWPFLWTTCPAVPRGETAAYTDGELKNTTTITDLMIAGYSTDNLWTLMPETIPLKDTTANVPDACSFIPKSELERLIGWELRDGKRKDVSPGLSQCDFTTPPQAYVTRRYDDPMLPEEAGFSSVVITTFPTTPATFAENRRVMPGGVRDIPSYGDDAFTYGQAMIYVRVGNRGFSIRLYVNDPKTQRGRVTLLDLLLRLARAGIDRL